MASSGSITTTNPNGYRNVTFSWTIQSQSTVNNNTVISWQVVGAQDGSDGWYYAGPFSLEINGSTIFSNIYPSGSRIELRKGTVVRSGTTTIAHNNDGTKSFSATITAAVYDLTNRSATGTWSLTTIPRTSTADVKSSYEIGSSYTIGITRSSNSFYHRLSYKYGSAAEVNISTSATTSATWNLTNWGNNIPDSSSAVVTVYLRTYPSSSDASSGTNLIGTKQYTVTLNVPDYSYTLTSTNVTRSEGNSSNTTGVYIQNISKLKVAISGVTAKYGATLSYKVTVAGQTITRTSSPLTTSTITKSGNQTATVTVSDSRGKSASTTISTTLLAYSSPKITVSKVERSATNGAQITCTISCSVTSILNGSTERNSMRAYAIYSTNGTYPDPSSTYQFTTSGLSASNATKTYALTATSTYYFQFRVADIFGYTSVVVKTGTGGILHITKNGIGVLKRREHGAVDVEGTIYSLNEVIGATSDEVSRYVVVNSAAGDISLSSNGSNNFRGIYVQAHGTGVAKSVISVDQNNNVTFDNGKTPLYTSGTQTISGNMIFTGYPVLKGAGAGYFPRYTFTNTLNDNAEIGGFGIYLDSTHGRQSQFGMRIYSYSSSTFKNLSYREDYWFPGVTADLTENKNYNILTTKNAVAVNQGGTGATTPANARSNLGVNQPAGLTSVEIAGNSTVTLSVTTANYKFYLFKFSCNSTITTIFSTYAALSTSAQKYIISDGTSSPCPILITRTASGFSVKRDGSTSCWCALYYWN